MRTSNSRQRKRSLKTTTIAFDALSLTTTHSPATDLGYLLHKNPARQQVFELNFGNAHIPMESEPVDPRL